MGGEGLSQQQDQHGQAGRGDGARGQQSAFDGADRAEQVRQRTADLTRDGIRTGMEATTAGMRRMGEEVSRTMGYSSHEAEALAGKARENVEALSRSGTVLALAWGDAARQWFGMAHDQFQRNLDGMQRIAASTSLHEAFSIQSEVARDGLKHWLEGGRHVSQIASHAVDKAGQQLSAAA